MQIDAGKGKYAVPSLTQSQVDDAPEVKVGRAPQREVEVSVRVATHFQLMNRTVREREGCAQKCSENLIAFLTAYLKKIIQGKRSVHLNLKCNAMVTGK